MPERTVKRRLQDAGDAALASDDGPIFSTVAKLIEALKRSIPEGTEKQSEKKKPCVSGVTYSAEPSTNKRNDHARTWCVGQRGYPVSPMNRPPTLHLAFAALLLTLGEAHAQYAYVTHPNVLVEQRATVAVLPANPLRAFAYCVIASPGKGEPLAPSVVRMGDATRGVPVQYPDRPPKFWASTGEVWVYSDQVALISCTELVRRQKR